MSADTPEDTDGQPFSATSRRDGNRAIVAIAGELDLSTVEPLTATLRDAITEGVDTVELDTTGVTFIDSRALAMFLAFQLNGPKEGVALRMVAASEEFARVATLAGLDYDLLPDGDMPDSEADADDSDDESDDDAEGDAGTPG